jgi:hypothetical protein
VDERYGPNIYAQRYSSDGTPLGNNILVNDDTNNRTQREPSIAADKNGNFVIAWLDNRKNNSVWRLYLQRYDSTGMAIGINLPIDSNVFSLFQQRNPDIAYGENGSIIVVWDEGLSGTYADIAMRRIDKEGNYMGDVVQVNDDFTDITQQHAAIASNSDGSFVVAWQDYRIDFNKGDIYYQRFDSSATLIGSNQRVNDDGIGEIFAQRDAAVALNDSGKFVIAWKDERHGNFDIFAQRYSPQGDTLGINFRVDDDLDSLHQANPEIALLTDGSFLVTWAIAWDGSDIFGQIVNSAGNLSGGNFNINDDTTGVKALPVVGIDANNNIVMSWQDHRHSMDIADIYMQRFNSAGSPVGENFKIEDHIWNGIQQTPAIENYINGNRIVVWQDNREGNFGIFSQLYNSEIVPIGSNLKINSTGAPYFNESPDVATGASDQALIVWSNAFFAQNRYRIRGQMVSDQGELSGTIFTIDSLDGPPGNVAVDYNNESYVVTWTHAQGADPGNIFARRLDLNGTPVGESFKVNDDVGSGTQNDPDIAISDSGNFLITFTDFRDGSANIYAQLYDFAGDPLNTNFRINDQSQDSVFFSSTPVTIASGKFAVSYVAYRSSVAKNVNIRYLESDGSFIGDNIRINDVPGSVSLNFPSAAADDSNKIIITWEDRVDDSYTIFGQRLIFNTKLDSNFSVATNTLSEQHNAAVALSYNEILNVWEDNRDETNVNNIYANVLEFGEPQINAIEDISLIPDQFMLHQNYPNPFNPRTTINYELPITNYVELNIYNLLGQKVTTLVKGRQPAGDYQVEWDASGFASGLYLYRLTTDNGISETKKLLLLK